MTPDTFCSDRKLRSVCLCRSHVCVWTDFNTPSVYSKIIMQLQDTDSPRPIVSDKPEPLSMEQSQQAWGASGRWCFSSEQQLLLLIVTSDTTMKTHPKVTHYFMLSLRSKWKSHIHKVNVPSYTPSLRNTLLQAKVFKVLIVQNGEE